MSGSSLRLSDEQLIRLVEEGEGPQVEFKADFREDASDQIRQHICAFANDIGGSGKIGAVFIGINDDGTPAGIDIDDRLLLTLTDMGRDGSILPLPMLLVERRSYSGQGIAVVTVMPSNSPPVRHKGVIRVRSGPRLAVASAQEEVALNERRRHGDRPFDVLPVPGTGIEDIDRIRFEGEYLPRIVDEETLRANDRSLAQRLAATKMIDGEQGAATILGLLVLGIRTRDFIPGAYVQFLRIAGRQLSDEIIDDMEICGTVSDIISGIDVRLNGHNRRQVDIVSGPRERRTQTYPIAALQQLVYNALMHRSYQGTNAPVRVSWFDDRIEIHNSGGPFGEVNRENFGQPGRTSYRNPNLAEAMKALGYVQRFGAGIQIARKLLAEAGHPEIEFTPDATHMLATVRQVSRPEGKQA